MPTQRLNDLAANRLFEVNHPAWKIRQPSWVRCMTKMIEQVFPWFSRGDLIGAHETLDQPEVRMSHPTRLGEGPKRDRNAAGWEHFPATGGRRSRKAFFSALD